MTVAILSEIKARITLDSAQFATVYSGVVRLAKTRLQTELGLPLAEGFHEKAFLAKQFPDHELQPLWKDMAFKKIIW